MTKSEISSFRLPYSMSGRLLLKSLKQSREKSTEKTWEGQPLSTTKGQQQGEEQMGSDSFQKADLGQGTHSEGAFMQEGAVCWMAKRLELDLGVLTGSQ